MPEWEPGLLTKRFVQVTAAGDARMEKGLTSLAIRVETNAKRQLAFNSHPYGTRTTAAPDGPPALVTGALRRSVTREPVLRLGSEFFTKVGPAGGFYPPTMGAKGSGNPSGKGKKRAVTGTGRTATSKYGYYLEMGLLRNGTAYPWLGRAFEVTMRMDLPVVMRTIFRGL